MTVLRGATTIAQDDKEEIRAAVKELLDELVKSNGIIKDEILSIVFSSTSDIHSFYPAKAAREAGYEGTSFFSAQEPDIQNGLHLCIRAMVFVEKNIEPHHVYLRGAKGLRKDLTQIIKVAIDGPAGSGKSTVAKRIARDCKLAYLDTGAMYRACALKAVQAGIDPDNAKSVEALMQVIELTVEYQNGVQHTLLDGKDVSEEIRRPEVSMAASTISKYACVRTKMVEKQREIARRNSCVVDGRDIGTVVLPDADFKFFLTARPEVRARRRFDELTAKGFTVDFEELKREIIARDEQDENRSVSPLRQAEDAVLVDSSDMTVEEVVSFIRSKIQEKI